MRSFKYFAAILAGATAPVLAQWGIVFYTEDVCTQADNYTRVFYAGFDAQCQEIGSPGQTCSVVTFVDGAVDQIYDCTGPNSQGLSGHPLLSFSGEQGDCEFYTDDKCSECAFQQNITSAPLVNGQPTRHCHTGREAPVKSFQCTFTGYSVE